MENSDQNPQAEPQAQPTGHRPHRLRRILIAAGVLGASGGIAAAAGAFDGGAPAKPLPAATAPPQKPPEAPTSPTTSAPETATPPTTGAATQPSGNSANSVPTPPMEAQTPPATTTPEAGSGAELATTNDVTNAIETITTDAASIPGCTNDGNGNINCYFPLDPSANDPNTGWTLQISNSAVTGARTIDLVGPPIIVSETPTSSQADRQELFITDGGSSTSAHIDLRTPNQTTDKSDIPEFYASVKDSNLTTAELKTLTTYFATDGTNAFKTVAQNPSGFDLSELNSTLNSQIQNGESNNAQ